MKAIKRFFMLCFLILVAVCGFYGYKGYEMYEKALADMPVREKVASIQAKKNYTKIEDMPEEYKNAVVAVEDRRFYLHGGVDAIAIARAVITDIKAMELKEGGSTITQQLAKNIYFTQERKLTRKIAEVFMAYEIEKECEKDEILELYLNTSYFGDGYYCVGDAAKGYFDKKPSEMTLYESTLLAGIPNAPSVYAPTKNPDLATQRQRQVLDKMVDCGYLTEDGAVSVMAEAEEYIKEL